MIVIEVAFFISILLDVAGADDGRRKEKMPKALDYCGFMLGCAVNNCMTVIELYHDHDVKVIERWGAIQERKMLFHYEF